MLKQTSAIASIVIALSGCATGLTAQQKAEYRSMEARNLLTQEKSPATGAWLGLLPGGGSFYAREPAFGILNLLTWPLSIMWDPVSGYDGAMAINYQASKEQIRLEKRQEQKKLNRDLEDGYIDQLTHARGMRDIEDKYDF